MTGVFSMTVWGYLPLQAPAAPAGGFTTPRWTMFHTPPCQEPHSQLREIHCCCEPDTTLPSILVSDSQPPLAQPPMKSQRSPAMCMRRIGAACDTAHTTLPLSGGLAVKFSHARQKFCVTLVLASKALVWSTPLMVTSSGDLP